jgi:hypothetical protein
MKIMMRLIAVLHALMAALFVCASIALIVIASHIGTVAVLKELNQQTAQEIIEAIGLLAAAVVALQIAQTIAEAGYCRAAGRLGRFHPPKPLGRRTRARSDGGSQTRGSQTQIVSFAANRSS